MADDFALQAILGVIEGGTQAILQNQRFKGQDLLEQKRFNREQAAAKELAIEKRKLKLQDTAEERGYNLKTKLAEENRGLQRSRTLAQEAYSREAINKRINQINDEVRSIMTKQAGQIRPDPEDQRKLRALSLEREDLLKKQGFGGYDKFTPPVLNVPRESGLNSRDYIGTVGPFGNAIKKSKKMDSLGLFE